MPGEDIYSWSVTAANNGNSDSAIEWREGQTRASVNNSSRAEMAAHAKHNKLTDGSITTTNTANAYAFTSGVGYTAVPTGMRVKLKIATDTNTGSATLNMDGIGDVTIKDDQGVNLKGGELVANAYTDLLYDGANWIFLYSHAYFFDLIMGGDGIIIGTQIFKVPGTFTYTPTSDLVQCAIVECIGGGGAGGGAWGTLPGTFFQGGGGGGGGYSRKTVTRTEIGVSQAVTVGAGGAAFAGNGPPGAASSFGTLCIANGGAGGIWGTIDSNPAPGAGGTAGTGDVTMAGTPGGFGWYANNTTSSYTMAGHGGSGPVGSYGAGGNGGSVFNNETSSFVAGVGGSGGIVIVTEFGGRGAPGRDGVDGAPGPAGPQGPAGAAGAGTGDVLVSGTPTVGQVAQWTDTSHIRGVDPSTVFNAFSTGDIKPTFKTAPDTGWVMLDDRTIGSATSGATNRANTDTLNLYTLLWNNCANADAPVSGGRGANAAADFGANKTLTLPKALGRAMMGAGAGASLTSRALGVAVGEERHAQSAAEMASHGHSSNSSIILSTGSGLLMGLAAGGDFSDYQATTFGTVTMANAGAGAPANVMQPSFAVNFMCKL